MPRATRVPSTRPEVMLILIYIALEILEFSFPVLPMDPGWVWISYDYVKRIFILAFIYSQPAFRQAIVETLVLPWSRHEGAGLGLIRLAAIVIALCIAQFFIEVVRLPSYVVLPDIRTSYPPQIIPPVLIWFDLIVGLMLVSFSEECVFRTIIYDALKKRNFSNGVIIAVSSVLFGLLHLSAGLPNTFSAMATGVFFMIVFIKTRSLWPTLVAHYVINYWYFGYHWQIY